jgi:hypothetical protein
VCSSSFSAEAALVNLHLRNLLLYCASELF